MVLSRLINAHPNFEMRYFAADGTDSLNKFHEIAFNSYEKYINNVINGKIILEDFLKYIKEHCIILPILDMFNGVKAGRNRIIDNILKLGETHNLISSDELKKSLHINDKTLNDKSSLGRMNDEYAIHLFRMKNVLIEFRHNHNSSGLYLLVFTMILEIFRNIYLAKDFRIDLSKPTLYLLLLFYQSCNDLPSETALKKKS